ncbi:hypothetical protein [Streptomyces anulatus]|uniref:hypothetical protein n=1 Tax=Streptomyces anulatus TaxID=1892 RepID=UPI0033E7F527
MSNQTVTVGLGALAAGLGWDLDTVEVAEAEPAVVTTSPRVGDHMCMEPGQIAAVTHAARGVLKGEVVIDLEITFGFFEPADEVAAVVEARPGLLPMGDLPARSVAAKGERRGAGASGGAAERATRSPRQAENPIQEEIRTS